MFPIESFWCRLNVLLAEIGVKPGPLFRGANASEAEWCRVAWDGYVPGPERFLEDARACRTLFHGQNARLPLV